MYINFLRYVQKKERVIICIFFSFEKEVIRFQKEWKKIAAEYGLIPVPEFKEGTIALGLYDEGILQCLRYDVPEERNVMEHFALKTNITITAYNIGE